MAYIASHCSFLPVPCLKRAADVEEYGEREEFEVESGGEPGEGWIAASTKPQGPVTMTNEEGFEEVPNISGEKLKYKTRGGLNRLH